VSLCVSFMLLLLPRYIECSKKEILLHIIVSFHGKKNTFLHYPGMIHYKFYYCSWGENASACGTCHGVSVPMKDSTTTLRRHLQNILDLGVHNSNMPTSHPNMSLHPFSEQTLFYSKI
jgi:hypothetical protein